MDVIARDIRVEQAEVCGGGLICSVISGVVDVEGHARYTTYGIAIRDSHGYMRLCIDDISTNKQFAEDFCEMCERSKVSLYHVMDVLEDCLG